MGIFRRRRVFLTPDNDRETDASAHRAQADRSEQEAAEQVGAAEGNATGPESEPQPDPALTAFAEYVRQRTQQEAVVSAADCQGEPLSLSEEAFQDLVQKLKKSEDEAFSDLELLQGPKSLYVYSSRHMSGAFARIQTRVRDKDAKATIAESVREESKIYPRPALRAQFLGEPFFLSEEEINHALEEMRDSEEFRDIQSCVTTDGTEYFYSEHYLTRAHALSIVDTRGLFDEE